MKKTISTTLAALVLSGLCFGAAVAPAAAAPLHAVVIHHPAHWNQHQVCKVTVRNHHKIKVCTWVNNHH
ncbi:MAG TPA: hypothetical protein VGO70_00470 [Arsenicitalea sp.]|jgi:hypothetical protein|nr:hypothetical protein [Arsenicitalea sp.]